MHVSTIAAILAFTAGMVTNAAPIASLDQLGTANAPLNANSKPEATPKGRGRQPTAGEVLSGVADASIIVANSKREARRRPGSTGAGGFGPDPTTSDPPGTNSKREARRRPGSTGAGGFGPDPTTSDPPGTNSKREARRRPGSTGAGGFGPDPTTSDPPGTNSKREASRRRPGSTGANGFGPDPTTSDPPVPTESVRPAAAIPGELSTCT